MTSPTSRPRVSLPSRRLEALLVLAASGCLLACGRSLPSSEPDDQAASASGAAAEVRLTPAQLANAGIEIARVIRDVPERALTLTGSIGFDERHTARVAPRIAGRVVRLVADFGDHVDAGAVLAVLDSPEVGEAQAEYLARAAEYDVARRALDRARRLVEHKAIAEGEYLEREGGAKRAEAAMGFAENRLHLLGMSDDGIGRLGAAVDANHPPHGMVSPELALRSPIAGTVTGVEASPGKVVERLETLFVVSDLSRVWAWLDVYEKDLGSVRRGTKAAITAEALPGERFEAAVDFVGNVDATTRAGRVRLQVTNEAGRLRPGMFVRAAVAIPRAGIPVLLVPEQGVQEIHGRSVVFRERSAGAFEVVPVITGDRFGDLIEVRDGLAEGDRIAGAGAFTLKATLQRSEFGEED